MRTRLRRATRLLNLQARMHQLAEQEHALLERRVQAADSAREDLIRALNEASAFHEPLRATAVHRLKRLAVAAQALRAEQEASAQQLRARATQHKRTELWVDRLGTEARQLAEKRDWAERLDRLTGTNEASLRSARPDNPAAEPRPSAAAAGSAPSAAQARRDPALPDTSTP